MGTRANAVPTLVWTALIAMPVLYLQLKSKFSWSLSTLAAVLRQQLFFYHDLWVWLDDPFHQGPPALAGVQDNAQQLPGKDVPDAYWLDEGVGFCISAFGGVLI